MKEHFPKLYNGFASIGVGALAALALNDSGLVSAATAIIYAVVPFLIIAFREVVRAKEEEAGDRPENRGACPEGRMGRSSSSSLLETKASAWTGAARGVVLFPCGFANPKPQVQSGRQAERIRLNRRHL